MKSFSREFLFALGKSKNALKQVKAPLMLDLHVFKLMNIKKKTGHGVCVTFEKKKEKNWEKLKSFKESRDINVAAQKQQQQQITWRWEKKKMQKSRKMI